MTIPAAPTEPHTLATAESSLRYQEPYVTDGVNRKFAGIIPRGIYRGFRLAVTGVADQFLVAADPVEGDHVAVYETAANRSVSHHITGDFTVTLDSGYQGSVVVVALYTQYVLGSTTTSKIRVYTPAQFAVAAEAAEVIILGRLTVPAGGVILAAGVSAEGRTIANLQERRWVQVVPNPTLSRTGQGWSRTVTGGSFGATTTAGRVLAGQTSAFMLTASGTASFTVTRVFAQPVNTSYALHYAFWYRRLQAAAAGTLVLTFNWRDQNGGSSASTSVTLDATATDAAVRSATGQVYPPSGTDRLFSVAITGAGLTYSSGVALTLNAFEVYQEPIPNLAGGVNPGYQVADHTQVNLHPTTGADTSPWSERTVDVSSPPSSFVRGVVSEVLSDATALRYAAGQLLGGLGITTTDSPYEARVTALPDIVDQKWSLLFESKDALLLGARVYYLSARTGSVPKLALVVGAHLVDDAGTIKWEKDLASNPASRIVLTGTEIHFEGREAATTGLWTDAQWSRGTAFSPITATDGGGVASDRVALGANLVAAGDGLLPRITLAPTSGDARTLLFQVGIVRFWYTSSVPSYLEVSVNGSWDGTNWTQEVGLAPSVRLILSGAVGIGGLFYFQTKASGSSPWADGSWLTTGSFSFADAASLMQLSGGRIQFNDTGGGLGNTNLAPTTVPAANTLYATSIAKAWGKFTTDGAGNVTIDGGLNIATVTLPGLNVIRITWALAFANDDYAVSPSAQSIFDDTVVVTGQTTTYVEFLYRRGGVVQDPQVISVQVHFHAFGLQV